MSNTLNYFDQCCKFYIENKLIQMVLCKNKISIFNKLKNVYSDL